MGSRIPLGKRFMVQTPYKKKDDTKDFRMFHTDNLKKQSKDIQGKDYFSLFVKTAMTYSFPGKYTFIAEKNFG